MPLPTSIKRLFSFTGFQQGQGDNSFPGTNLDADLDQTNNALSSLLTTVALIVRPDGKLAAGSVWRGALGADILLGVGPSKPWSASQAYVANVDTVTRLNKVYLALVNSTGVDPAADVTSAYWIQTADLSQSVVVADGSLGANALAPKSVTEPKFADGAVSNRALGTGAVGRANAALNLGVVPVGAEISFPGPTLPAGWLFCAGQAVSRVTYPDLFAALTLSFQATTAASSSALTSVSQSLAKLGLRGAAVEGPGIPQGTTLATDADGGVTLSQSATGNGAVTLRLFPYGRGDGSSTFNLPDRRGRAVFGRDDMAGTAAGRLTQAFNGATLAGAGGAERVTLVNANLPSALPAESVTVAYPPHQYNTFVNLVGVSAGAGGTTIANVWQGVTPVNTGAPNPVGFNVTNTNTGGDTPFSVVPPSGVTNTIIFAGV